MPLFVRHMIRESAMMRPSGAGDGLALNSVPYAFAAEADATLTVAQLSSNNIFQGTTLTSDVVYTLPTAILIAAACLDMSIGDSFSFLVTNSQVGAFDVEIAVGAGITAVGANNTLAVPPQNSRIYTLVMTDDTDGAETYDLY